MNVALLPFPVLCLASSSYQAMYMIKRGVSQSQREGKMVGHHKNYSLMLATFAPFFPLLWCSFIFSPMKAIMKLVAAAGYNSWLKNEWMNEVSMKGHCFSFSLSRLLRVFILNVLKVMARERWHIHSHACGICFAYVYIPRHSLFNPQKTPRLGHIHHDNLPQQ
jgi:hypothetical protein